MSTNHGGLLNASQFETMSQRRVHIRLARTMYDKSDNISPGSDSEFEETINRADAGAGAEIYLDDFPAAWAGRSRGPQPEVDAADGEKPAYVLLPKQESPLRGYFLAARNFGLLTPLEEREIGRKARAGDSRAQTRLVECNLRLVVKIAKRFAGRGLDFDDLMQEGNLGLIRAAQLFDPDKGARFSTYATMWIIQFVSRAVDNQGRSVRLPVNVHNDMRLVSRKVFHFTRLYGTEPTVEQIAQMAKISITRVKNAMDNMQAALSLNQRSAHFPDSEIGERIAGSDGQETEEMADKYFQRQFVDALLSRLTQDERRAICLHYGIGENDVRGFREIAESEGLTIATVRRLLNSAMKKLKRYAAAPGESEEGGSPVVHGKPS